MTWLAWRQFRANAALAVVATAAVVVVLVVTRDRIAELAGQDLPTGYKSMQLLGTALIGTPAFIGAFWGAPLLARELEMGTHRLAWTQSVTRRRWLATKLAVAGLCTIVVTAVFSLVFTWWSQPLDEFGNRIGTANFGQRGITPVAYALFALALGTLAGAVLRRTLPAMATTLVGFFVVRFAFQLAVRPHLLATETATLPNNLFGQREGQSGVNGGWIMSSKTVDAAGHIVSSAQIDQKLNAACDASRETTVPELARCANRLGFHDVVKWHPPDQFWPLQGWETALFLAFAAALALGSFWWIRHRTA